MNNRTKTTSIFTILTLATSIAVTAKDDHDHHNHHDHAAIVAGPNNGRVFTELTPELEFVVMEDRSIQIHQLDSEHHTTAMGNQSVSAITGDRTNPTIIGFKRDGDFLISNTTLPDGNDFPIVVTVRGEDGSRTRIRFNLNLAPCPTCDHLEYACECDHHHEEHDHD
jgi:hypothetical protein